MSTESIEITARRIERAHGTSLARFFLALVESNKKDGHNVSCNESDANILAEYLRLHDTSLERVSGGYILRRHEVTV
ncbi:hypothetical protein FJY94_02600 [Candidatus Kaiserbacteria bacterium]|nr:hypothetical protein [Candidatus Kaiserbacteria bacterium]